MTTELTSDDYMDEMDELSVKLDKLLGGKSYWNSYSGGVPGMSMDLKAKKYSETKRKLTKLFGEPEVVKPWFPQHTKGISPIIFRVTKEMEHLKVSHVHLIHMMQWKKKQYIIVSWM